MNEIKSGVPADAEIIEWARQEQFVLFCDEDELLDIVKSALQRFSQRPARDAVDLARAGMELHTPGQPEYIVCAELVRIASYRRRINERSA